MLFGIFRNSNTLSINEKEEPRWQEIGDAKFFVKEEKAAYRGFFRKHSKGLTYTSEPPYLRHADGYETADESVENLAEVVRKAENNFAACQLVYDGTDWTVYAASARITRGRMYFLLLKDGLLLSDDLRKLLPYSDREMDPMGAFSILKYGDVPEYITVVKGIFCIPVGQELQFNSNDLNRWLLSQHIPREDFGFFFKLDFPMDGGDLQKTEKLLESEFSFVAGLDPIVPISGGVDSALANCLIDRFSDAAYPAYYIQFGEDDPELPFALEAARATKAELDVAVFKPEDTIPSFLYQTQHAIQPIGESSTISTAFYFQKQPFHGRKVIDGTLADGCYGSTDYNQPLWGQIPNRPAWQQHLNEWIASQLQYRKLAGYDRFHPRDSYVKDRHLQFMDVYLGPFGNMWLKDAKRHSQDLVPLWQFYYDYLKPEDHDDWMRYSVFKMVNYACKNNTAKTYDNSQPENSGLYPFTWLSVLRDQGHYTWMEKSADNTIKYPLKNILSNYMRKDFIHRKKVGLNSCFEDWIHRPFLKDHFSNVLSRAGGATEYFLGQRKNKLLHAYSKELPLHPNLARLVINLCILDAWLQHHRIRVK